MATPTTHQPDTSPEEAAAQTSATLGRRAGPWRDDVRTLRADAQLHAWVESQVVSGLDRTTACRLAVLLLCVRGVKHDAGFLLGAAAHVEAALIDAATFEAACGTAVDPGLARVWVVLAGCTTGVSRDRCLQLARLSRRRGLEVVAS